MRPGMRPLGWLLPILAVAAGDEELALCRREYQSCADAQDQHCCTGFQCEAVPNQNTTKCVPDPTYRNQCCMPNMAWGCDIGDCCKGFYCWFDESGTRSECRPGEEYLGLHNGLCDASTDIDTAHWKNTPVPYLNRCEIAGEQSNCEYGYLCQHPPNKPDWPPKCYKDPTVETECCKKMGWRRCDSGDCCPGSFCYDDGNGFTQCRPGTEPSGKHDGMCDPPTPDDCRKHLKKCRRYAGIDNCCAGYECVEVSDGDDKCIPKLGVRNECCRQNYERGCNVGDCCEGSYCEHPGEKKSRCKPGPEKRQKKNGLCPAKFEIEEDAYKSTCAMPKNRCNPGVEGLGSQGDCCTSFLCQQKNGRAYPTCEIDESIDTTCCLPYGSIKCTPGDCCDGFMCEQDQWLSRCVPGEEFTGRKDGLCSIDEALLHCEGHVGHVWGDPHVTTFDGFQYNCQGRGEFVITKSRDRYFEVQGRFQDLEKYGKPNVSTVRALAVSASEDRSIPTVQVNYAPNRKSNSKTFQFNECDAQLWIGGVLQDINKISTFEDVIVTWTGYSIQIQFGPKLDYAAVEVRSAGEVDGKYGCHMSANTCLPSSDPRFTSDVVGMLGSPNYDTADDWIKSEDGSTLPQSDKSSDGYEFCTQNYCMQDPSESLFTYGLGDSHDTYMDCTAGYPGDIVIDIPDHIKEKCNFDRFCMEEATVGGEEGLDDARREEEIEDEIKNPAEEGASSQDRLEEDEDAEEVDCPKNIELIAISGVTKYERSPLRVVSQDESTVTLKVINPFKDENRIVNYMYYEYKMGDDQCDMSENIEESFEDEFTAECMVKHPVAIVRVWVADGDQLLESEEAQIAKCCHVEDDMDLPVVEWVFKVSCVPLCVEE